MNFLYILGLACCWVFGSSAAVLAQGSTLGSNASLEGLWQTQASETSSEPALSVGIKAVASNLYMAVLDAPTQKLTRTMAELKQPAGTDSVLLLVPQTHSCLLARRSADGQELSGQWCQAGLQAAVVLHWAPLPLAEAGGRPTRPYRQEEITFLNFTSRTQLAGTLTVPSGSGPFPAFVLVSDLGEQDRDGLSPSKEVLDPMTSLMSYRLLGSLADYLTRHGAVVLRFDDRGVGESGGSNAAATPAQRAGDVQAALNFMRTRSEVDILRLGLIGHGEGANVALLAAAQPLPLACVIGLGAYGLPGYETLLTQQAALLRAKNTAPDRLDLCMRRQRALYDLIRYPTNLPQTQAIVTNLLRQAEPGLAPAAAQAQAASLLTPWHRAFLSFDPLENLEEVQCPVLLITGQLDEQAPPAQHLSALEHMLRSNSHHNVTARRLPNVNHLLQPPRIEWTMLNGEMKPVLANALTEVVQHWLATELKM